jgi:uncharacterized protein YbcV (DUF1398 family)
MNNMNETLNKKAQLLKEFIQNDPYLAFFISFFSDIGTEPITYNPVFNETTNTKFYATKDRKLVIEQNSKRLEIKINQAKKILEDTFGPIPLEIF